ncbi:hypothetical protein OMP38_15975 [Cohnella ginsengisoli]|uniref:Uncharacterized protein n=1 Tax=Cohnella ginsengisoli TaxID=425004 RepID=A0A9X4KKR3_9BACL|nr:hypothetical protein [Cohnella ginsengisoli]MDG0792197.1 hypothetical protein [Cohnella ginsengisoli]
MTEAAMNDMFWASMIPSSSLSGVSGPAYRTFTPLLRKKKAERQQSEMVALAFGAKGQHDRQAGMNGKNPKQSRQSPHNRFGSEMLLNDFDFPRFPLRPHPIENRDDDASQRFLDIVHGKCQIYRLIRLRGIKMDQFGV